MSADGGDDEDRVGDLFAAPARHTIRAAGPGGLSLSERVGQHVHRWSWRTPLHSLRLRGRYPLKLLAVPRDPIAGDPATGAAILAGRIEHQGASVAIETLDFADPARDPALADHLQSFAWLRDLAAAAPRETAAPIAEAAMRRWLDVHDSHVSEAGWRPDLWGRRILFWSAYAPLILSSPDLVYRSAVLNTLARGSRHLRRGADRAVPGLARVTAWTGALAAALLIPGDEVRIDAAEAGLARALAGSVHADGGIVTRAPVDQLALVELLAQLRGVYEARRRPPTDSLAETLARGVAALIGVTLGDGGLSSWQGGAPLPAARVRAAVVASGVRDQPLVPSRDWGYQRIAQGQTLLILDAAPPPVARVAAGGSASTLAFELSDGPHRLIVNCGGSRGAGALSPELAEALRSSAAHSTLVIADTNSTSIHPDGSFGRGVGEVDLDRDESDSGSRIAASHDGYVRRFGLVHHRRLLLVADGRILEGEDALIPSGRRRRADPLAVALRFHLCPQIEVTSTADGLGALLRIPQGALWQFRCQSGTLGIEDSLWIDPAGRPRPSLQLVVAATVPSEGATIGWTLKRAG